jgi:glycosyltransferase involved in cell wall biosynthesis
MSLVPNPSLSRARPSTASPVTKAHIRVGHLTTVDVSLAKLLRTELQAGLESGHDVVGLSASGPYVDDLERLGIRHVAISHLTRRWSLIADLRASAALWTILGDLKLDVLHTHTPKAGVMGRVVGRLRHVPVVVNTCHGLVATEYDRWRKRFAVKVIEGLATRLSHAELYQNPEDRQVLASFLRGRICMVVGNGTDLNTFQFDPDARREIRSQLGVGPDEVLVGGVGRTVAEKGLIEYSNAACRPGPPAQFVWIGPIDSVKADSISELPGVRMLGERHDMAALYSALDIFVLPSHREGFPRSAMEAAACGRPLVLTNIRGCREIGRDGVEVLFVPPRNSVRLADAIDRLITDGHLRRVMGEAAQRRATAAFDQRRVARLSYEAYRIVADQKGLSWAANLSMPEPSPVSCP